MNIAIAYLNYKRPQQYPQVMESIQDAGYPYTLFEINRKGIAAALNDGIDLTKTFDGVVFCANDIVMPSGWLAKMVDLVQDIPSTGMCACYLSGEPFDRWRIYNREIMVTPTPLGNALIPRKALDAVGYFNEALDPYGFIDGDYSMRLRKSGFINYYVPDTQITHLGHDAADSEYQRQKDQALQRSWDAYHQSEARYNASNDYTIFQRQFPGE